MNLNASGREIKDNFGDCEGKILLNLFNQLVFLI